MTAQLSTQTVDPIRAERLRRRVARAEADLPGVVRQAYNVVVTVGTENQVHAFKLQASGHPLFAEIKAHRKARITDTPVNPEALLPAGPYDLWREGEESRFLTQLAGAFARYPHLPKVLRPRLVTETVLAGVRDGHFVARLGRPDESGRTWWRESVDGDAVGDDALEIVLPEKARLARLDEGLLAPDKLPDLWKETEEGERSLPVRVLTDYFAGGHVAMVPQENYAEQAPIPACPADIVLDAVQRAVESGVVWMTNPPATTWKEPVPAGTLNKNATLHPPPPTLTPRDLTREAVPTAWRDNSTNGLALTQALSQQRSATVPWGLVREGIGAAVNARWLVLADGSEPVASTYDQAARVVLEVPAKAPVPEPPTTSAALAVLDVAQLQDLAEGAAELLAAVEGAELRFRVGVEVDGEIDDSARERVDAILAEVADDLKSG